VFPLLWIFSRGFLMATWSQRYKLMLFNCFGSPPHQSKQLHTDHFRDDDVIAT